MVDVLKRSLSKAGEKEVMERGKDKLVPGESGVTLVNECPLAGRIITLAHGYFHFLFLLGAFATAESLAPPLLQLSP